MKYLVLGPVRNGRNIFDSRYRGIERCQYSLGHEDENLEQKAQKVFSEVDASLNYSNPNGTFITQLDLATKAAKIYSECSGEEYTVYEITMPFEIPMTKKNFVGFDIIQNNLTSFVALYFNSDFELNDELKELKLKYYEHLNESKLFSSLEKSFEVYQDLSRILKKNLADSYSHLFVVGLWEDDNLIS